MGDRRSVKREGSDRRQPRTWSAPAVNTGREEIARRAYEIFKRRGAEDGRDVEDWLQAERDLQMRRRGAE